MNRLLGYSLMGVGGLGFAFFLKYNGVAIPLKELWFVLSFFTFVAGSYFFAKDKIKKLDNRRDNTNTHRLVEIDRLKQRGDRVKITLDNAEVKTRTYQQEVIPSSFPSRIEIADGLYDSNRNYKTEEIRQTYIVFYKQYSGKTYKFISPATTQDAESFKLYLDRKGGFYLYIDPNNPTSYYFDFPFR